MSKIQRAAVVGAVNVFSLFVVGTLYIAFVGRFGVLFEDWFDEVVRNWFYAFGVIVGGGGALMWVVLLCNHLVTIAEDRA